jgi:hypothetical protein
MEPGKPDKTIFKISFWKNIASNGELETFSLGTNVVIYCRRRIQSETL